MSVDVKTGIPSIGSAQWLPGFVVLALAIVGGGAFFWDGIASLVKAWGQPEYSHGPIIPLIAGYLLLRDIRRRGLVQESGGRWPGFLVIGLGMLIGLMGNLTQIPYFITYGLIVAIGGLILVVAGTKRGIGFWAAWFYLIFMLPLPTATYWQVSTRLQFVSSQLGVEFIRMANVPVLLEGNVIDLGVYKLQVAEACSGLRYLFPLASFGFLFAALYNGPWWHKLIIFLSSAPITVFMNSLRIGVIGVLVDSYGIDQAEGFLHWFEGWVIFVACMAILFAEAFILQRFTKNPQPLLNTLDLDTTGIFQNALGIFRLEASKALYAAATVLVLAGLAWQLIPDRAPPVVERRSFQLFPLDINGWTGEEIRLDPTVEVGLGADEYLSSYFTSPNKEHSISFFSAYYFSTTDGSGIHSPQICIPGGGWEVSAWRRYDVPVTSPNGRPLSVNRAVIQKDNERQIVYYWFDMRGERFVSEYRAKLETIYDSLTDARADGALVRLITPIKRGETEADADARLATFSETLLKVLPEYIPE